MTSCENEVECLRPVLDDVMTSCEHEVDSSGPVLNDVMTSCENEVECLRPVLNDVMTSCENEVECLRPVLNDVMTSCEHEVDSSGSVLNDVMTSCENEVECLRPVLNDAVTICYKDEDSLRPVPNDVMTSCENEVDSSGPVQNDAMTSCYKEEDIMRPVLDEVMTSCEHEVNSLGSVLNDVNKVKVNEAQTYVAVLDNTIGPNDDDNSTLCIPNATGSSLSIDSFDNKGIATTKLNCQYVSQKPNYLNSTFSKHTMETCNLPDFKQIYCTETHYGDEKDRITELGFRQNIDINVCRNIGQGNTEDAVKEEIGEINGNTFELDSEENTSKCSCCSVTPCKKQMTWSDMLPDINELEISDDNNTSESYEIIDTFLTKFNFSNIQVQSTNKAVIDSDVRDERMSCNPPDETVISTQGLLTHDSLVFDHTSTEKKDDHTTNEEIIEMNKVVSDLVEMKRILNRYQPASVNGDLEDLGLLELFKEEQQDHSSKGITSTFIFILSLFNISQTFTLLYVFLKSFCNSLILLGTCS